MTEVVWVYVSAGAKRKKKSTIAFAHHINFDGKILPDIMQCMYRVRIRICTWRELCCTVRERRCAVYYGKYIQHQQENVVPEIKAIALPTEGDYNANSS